MKIGNLKIYGIIYRITNQINKKVYIGQTKNKFNRRYPAGEWWIYSKNKHLKDSAKKYGVDNFKLDIIDYAFSKDELDIKEKSYIVLYKSNNRLYGYNNDDGGHNGVQNEETRKRMSELKQGVFDGNKNPNAKQIVNVIDNKHFELIETAKIYYNTSYKSIYKAMNNAYIVQGKGIKMYFIYESEYSKLTNKDIEKIKDKIYELECSINDKRIVNIETKIIYDRPSDIINNEKDIKNISIGTILKCCDNKQRYAGMLNNKPCIWVRYSDFIKMTQADINLKIYEANSKEKALELQSIKRKKKVKCITTNKEFNSIGEASEFYNCDRSGISQCCLSHQKSCGSLEDGTLLVWEYC